ncbi:MAG: UMP kinase [Clostridia bacterium]|jgi:uridylate kinase|nr:UMP kinase [Clostridia bacterium]
MYKRVLLKLSGEALAGQQKTGINAEVVDAICQKVVTIAKQGVQVGIVVGGGNFWRGKYGYNMESITSDYMGMLATVINALAVKDALESKGVKAVVETSISMVQIAETYTKRDTEKHFEEGAVVIFGGGTGHPFFSTDTGAALRAAEIGADAILVAKTIDGVYSADPKIDPNAIKYDEITYTQVLNENLKVMDSAAIAICRDNNIPLVVFALEDPENIVRVINGEKIGTVVKL